MRFTARSLWILFIIISPILAVITLGLGLLPYEFLRPIADALSKDGSMDAFTPTFLAGMRPFSLFGGVIFLAITTGLGFFRQKSTDLIFDGIIVIKKFIREAGADTRQLARDVLNIRISRLEIGVLLTIFGFGLFNRLVLLPAPMQYDEAYTFMAFARRPFWDVISDYELPNNHVFHTILVRISYLLFGNSPEAIRLPALIAGLLVIPLIYLVARRLYNRETGWMAAGLVAFWPLATTFSVNARGYSLLMVFTLVLLGLASYLVEKRNIAGWLAFMLVSALGFFTVPVMLYSFGTVMVWMGLTAWTNRAHLAYRGRQFLKYFVFGGIGTLALTGIFYAPVIYRSGWRALFANPFIQSFSWNEFWNKLTSEWAENFYLAWTANISQPVVWLMLVGLAAGLIFHKKISTHKVPVLAVMLAWVIAMVIIQRPELISKIFLGLVPIISLAIAAGWFAIVRWLPKIWKINFSSITALLITLGLMIGIYQIARPNLPYLTSTVQGNIEQTVLYIKERHQPDEIVIATFPDDPQVWYYSLRHGLDLNSMLGIHQKIYSLVWVIVAETERQTLESVIQDANLTGVQPDIQKAVLQTTIDNIKIYTVPPQ